MKLRCDDCKTPLTWSGKGRKPKRCKPCSAVRTKTRQVAGHRRQRLHEAGKPASKWGDLWLYWDPVNGYKPIRRDRRQVWGATGDNDEIVSNRSGVFHYIGRHGLPEGGVSTTHKDLQAQLQYMNKRAQGADDVAKNWLQENPNWWKFETFAHDSFSKDVVDSTTVHGNLYEDDPDEHCRNERCSWCGESRVLVLADEFCSQFCFTDYIRTYGAQGLTFSRRLEDEEEELMEAA